MDEALTDYQRGMLDAALICEAQMAWVLKPGWGELVAQDDLDDHYACNFCARAIRKAANLPPKVT